MIEMTTRKQELHGKYRLILLGVLLLGGCVLFSFTNGIESKPGRKVPKIVSTFNHYIHIDMEMECTECHEGAQEEEKAGLPEIGFCMDCHEDDENEAYLKWMENEPKKDGSVIITREKLKSFREVIFPHGIHYAADLTCDTCHGETGKAEKIIENTIVGKSMCMECHEGELDCSDCHKVIRKTTKPSNHDSSWTQEHGRTAFLEPGGLNRRCLLCHVESSCRKCHRTRRPSSHGGSWKRLHGSEVDMDFELQENRCYFCHRQMDCKNCHKTETPSSHTASWRNRTHGLHAETERDSCMVCHKQAYCARCHRAAPPQPRDPAHIANADCRPCHTFLDHGFRSTENFECAKCHK